MANAVNKNLKPGTEVLVLAELMTEENQEPEKRTFVCESGFGMMSFTTGGKIAGHWKADGEPGIIRGEWIESIVSEPAASPPDPSAA